MGAGVRFGSEGLPLVDVGISSTSTFGVEADADDGDDLVSSFWGADEKRESCLAESLRTTIFVDFAFILSDRPLAFVVAGATLFDGGIDTAPSMRLGDVVVDEFVSQAQIARLLC
jgi:hypothetical protein